MALSTALFALGAGLNATGNIASTAGNRADLMNAPDQRRYQGNIFATMLANSLCIAKTIYKSPDYARVAETLEKTGYRVDETSHCYLQSLQSFLASLINRKYWLPIQFTATFSCALNVPKDTLDDIAMRCSNGIRFHRVMTSGVADIGADLRYDNVEGD